MAQLAQKLADTETKVITVTERIYAAPVTRECAASPSMRAATDGVRALISGGQAGDRAQPSPAVRLPVLAPENPSDNELAAERIRVAKAYVDCRDKHAALSNRIRGDP